MRPPLRKELLKQFSEEVTTKLPLFSRCEAERGDPAHILWAWEIDPSQTCFLKLKPMSNRDSFVLEYGWSDNSRYPWDSTYPTQVDIGAKRFRQRLSRLWWKQKEEYQWDIEPTVSREEHRAWFDAYKRGEIKDWFTKTPLEELFPRVKPLVQDSVGKFVEYALPVFHCVAQQRKIG